MTEDYIAYALIAICVILILLPPKWDPAIQIKERQTKRRNRLEGRWIICQGGPADGRTEHVAGETFLVARLPPAHIIEPFVEAKPPPRVLLQETFEYRATGYYQGGYEVFRYYGAM